MQTHSTVEFRGIHAKRPTSSERHRPRISARQIRRHRRAQNRFFFAHIRNAASNALRMLPAFGILLITCLLLPFSNEHHTPIEKLYGIVTACRNPLICLSMIHAVYYLFQSYLWAKYKPYPKQLFGESPTVSVIIPAYNEGKMIQTSILSVLKSKYFKDKIDIICVDDGSTDDTAIYIRECVKKYPNRIQFIQFSKNCGKRVALQKGIAHATGSIVVTLDSDSLVEAETIQEIVSPFLCNPKIGAVAGNVRVLNKDNLLGKMLDVQYNIAFDFCRAAQSSYNTVACCPGALSAFRRTIIAPHLKSWAHQMFLGRPVRHGEDQALTNIVLKQGYDTVYQRTAVVHTVAPSRYKQLCKMFARWDRSFIVEGFCFASFMFSNYRQSNRSLPIINFVLKTTQVYMVSLGLIGLIHCAIYEPRSLIKYSIAFLCTAFCSAAYYLWTHRGPQFLYGVLYAVFSLFMLQWIFPWAVLTVRDESWGTR